MSQQKVKYYEAVESENGFRARIYTWEDDQRTMKLVWLSDREFADRNQALDAAADYAEDAGYIDLEMA